MSTKFYNGKTHVFTNRSGGSNGNDVITIQPGSGETLNIEGLVLPTTTSSKFTGNQAGVQDVNPYVILSQSPMYKQGYSTDIFTSATTNITTIVFTAPYQTNSSTKVGSFCVFRNTGINTTFNQIQFTYPSHQTSGSDYYLVGKTCVLDKDTGDRLIISNGEVFSAVSSSSTSVYDWSSTTSTYEWTSNLTSTGEISYVNADRAIVANYNGGVFIDNIATNSLEATLINQVESTTTAIQPYVSLDQGGSIAACSDNSSVYVFQRSGTTWYLTSTISVLPSEIKISGLAMRNWVLTFYTENYLYICESLSQDGFFTLQQTINLGSLVGINVNNNGMILANNNSTFFKFFKYLGSWIYFNDPNSYTGLNFLSLSNQYVAVGTPVNNGECQVFSLSQNTYTYDESTISSEPVSLTTVLNYPINCSDLNVTGNMNVSGLLTAQFSCEFSEMNLISYTLASSSSSPTKLPLLRIRNSADVTVGANNNATINTKGLYYVNIYCFFTSNSSGSRGIYLLTNNNQSTCCATQLAANGIDTIINVTRLLNLNSSDLLTVYAYQNSGSSLVVNAELNLIKMYT